MRAALYYRVSTKLQEDRYSLPAQKEELTRYANAQGWKIIKEFKDIDSGGKLDKAGLNALMDFVEERKIDVVLCIDQDRLSRLDTISWEFLKATLRDHDVKIAEPGNIVDLKNEDDEFISDIKNLIAKREKRAIVRRMMRGKRQRTREGKGWGRSPTEYVYDRNHGTYSVNDKWAWVIPYIDDLYINKGLSDQAIAHKLNEICKTPSGKKWTATHIKQKLTNKAYHGIMEKTFSNGETITVDDIYPQLRTADEYEQIQKIRKRKYRRRKEVYPQLLRRVNMKCGYCGRKLTITMSGDKKYSIHFYIEHSRKLKSDGDVCNLKINTVRVDPYIIKAIKDILTSEEAARNHLQLEYTENDIKDLDRQIKALNKLKNDTQAKIDRLLPLYLDGSWSKEQLDKQKDMLENELKVHEDQLQRLKNKRDLQKKNMYSYDVLINYMQVAERFDVRLDKHEQMELVGKLFPNATVYGDVIHLKGNLPGNIPVDVKVKVGENPYKSAKGRGSENIASKLTSKDVKEIRHLHEKGHSYRKIASRFNISISTVGSIIKKKTWKHI